MRLTWSGLLKKTKHAQETRHAYGTANTSLIEIPAHMAGVTLRRGCQYRTDVAKYEDRLIWTTSEGRDTKRDNTVELLFWRSFK